MKRPLACIVSAFLHDAEIGHIGTGFNNIRHILRDKRNHLLNGLHPHVVQDHVGAHFQQLVDIEEIEAATPLTHMRYLATPAGSIYGWEQYTKDSMFFQPSRKSPIEGLYFAGGWVGDCGFQTTMQSGVSAAKSIARKLAG